MKERNILIVLTILLLLSGIIVGGISFFDNQKKLKPCNFDGKDYRIGEVVDNFQENSSCSCSEAGYIECVPITQTDDSNNTQADPTIDLKTKGLTFKSRYIVGFASNTDVANVLPLEFKDGAYEGTTLKVVLEQLQTCPELNTPPQQFGFYNYSSNVVTLENMVRKSEDPSAVQCVVELTYEIKDIISNDVANLKIQFKDENENITTAPFCSYYGKIYANDDVFKSKDSGNICTCSDGLVACE